MKNRVVFAAGVCFVGLLVGNPGRLVSNEGQAPTLPRLLVSHESEFGIPFTMDNDATSGSGAAVRLFYSNDFGVSWNVAQEARPEDSKFVFQAGEDGEYWFALDTIDGGPDSTSMSGVGDATDIGAVAPLAPGLRVLVDTTEPSLDFEVGRTASDRLWAAWSIQEMRLRDHGFHILYRGVEEEYWTSVPVAAPDPSGQDLFEGWTAWDLDAPYDEIVVRAEAIDAAGNSTVFTDRFDLAETGLPITASPRGRERTPVVASPESVELEIAPVSNTVTDGWRPASALRDVPPSSQDAGDGAQQARQDMSGWRPADRDLSQDADAQTLEQPEVEAEHVSEPESVEDLPVVETTPVEPVSVVRTPEGSPEDVPQRSLRLPVEDDAEVDAEVDGMFGFAEPEPIRIRSAKTEIADGNTWLKIRWSPGDPSMRDAVVSLYYADSIKGPWRLLTDSVSNSGRFEGPLALELFDTPEPIFIRLEALLKDGSIISTMRPEAVVVE